MIVVDTNIIAYYYLTSTQTENARLIMAKDPDWLVPPLWKSEFRNALIQYVRHEIISLEAAIQIMNESIELLETSELPVYSNHVLQLAAGSSCSTYDCEFVSLAVDVGVPLVTADKRILRGFPQTAVSPADFIAA